MPHQSPSGYRFTTRVRICDRPTGGLLRDRNLEHGVGQFERAADRQRLVSLSLRVPFLDVEVKAGQPMAFVTLACLPEPGSSFTARPF